MSKLCKDKEKRESDAAKAEKRKHEGKSYFVCKKCGRETHKEGHVCKAEKVKDK